MQYFTNHVKVFSILKLCLHHIKEYGNGIATNACKIVLNILGIGSNSTLLLV